MDFVYFIMKMCSRKLRLWILKKKAQSRPSVEQVFANLEIGQWQFLMWVGQNVSADNFERLIDALNERFSERLMMSNVNNREEATA